MSNDPNPKPLTVAELIRLLQAQDGSLPVSLEGCDCTGDASGVAVHGRDANRVVLITRHP